MKVVVFLDFDGVLHPMPCRGHELFQQMPLLAAVLGEFSDIEIVISSAWRETHSLDELKVHFPEGIRHLAVGLTPVLHRHGSDIEFERQREIQIWLLTNRPVGTPWLAIDDWRHGFEPGCQDVLVTHHRLGFQPSDVQTLKAMIKIRMNEL